MASELIGTLYPTQIPGYADNADIQAAFKLYHYGSTEYNTANSNTANLVNPSIAYTLNDIQSQITSLDPAGGVSKSIIDAKGDLLVGLSNDTIDNLTVGSNNFVLTADSSATLGIKWAAPEVTTSNTVTFTNKSVSLATNTLTGTTGQFNAALSDGDFATLAGTETLTNKTFNLSSNTLTGTIAQFNTAVSNADLATLAGAETLTNKTIAIGSNTVSGTIAEFNTAVTDADFATLAGTETFTNKTLTSPTINDPKTNLTLNANTATTYTFVLADNGKLVTSNNASGQTLSIPTNASVAYPVGAQINVAWITGAGQPTISAVTPGTTTIISTGATSTAPKLRVVNSVATCIKIATDTWLVTGDIS